MMVVERCVRASACPCPARAACSWSSSTTLACTSPTPRRRHVSGVPAICSPPQIWIELNEPLKQQLPSAWRMPARETVSRAAEKQPVLLEFGVKFFVSQPDKLCEEYTRYLFFLQLKEARRSGHGGSVTRRRTSRTARSSVTPRWCIACAAWPSRRNSVRGRCAAGRAEHGRQLRPARARAGIPVRPHHGAQPDARDRACHPAPPPAVQVRCA